MTAEQSQRVKDVFESVLDSSPPDRLHLLGRLCADDVIVRMEVEALLRAHTEADGFLAGSPFGPLAFERGPAPPFDFAGRRIGAYRLQREIGQGGMATVYLAERIDGEYRQQVALKLVWPGGDLSEITRRFKRERQILATLHHPNIARLLDGGTTAEGWPYLVMEYIAGVPITHYCRKYNLPLAERLRLFQTVCAAVAYAHRNLVVHRDIKPSNILVTEDGAVKLLDFGIAKLLAPESSEQQTITGLRPMTPEYASPEQLREETITTATDVYSLGVLLYELLTGTHPHDLKDRPLHEIIRIVCEEDPPPPSARTRQLRGDLDNIIMRALRKDARQRYQTVEQFSEDISRFLAGKTVNARPATLHYRTGKFIKRHKTQLAVVLVAFVALFGFLAREIHLRRWVEQQNLSQRRQLYSAQMQQTQQHWQDGNLARMRETLANWQWRSGEDDLRGFEWRYFWRLLNADLLTIELLGGIRAMAPSPDGSLIATGMDDGTARLINSQTGQQIASLSGHSEVIRGIAYSPDGKLLATGDAIGVTRLWEVASKREIRQVGGHGTNIIHAVAFSPDNKTFVTGSKDGTAKLWSVEDGNELIAFKGHRAGVRTLLFSPDGQTLFTGGDDSTIRCWDIASGKELRTLRGFPVEPLHLVVTRDGKYLLGCGAIPEIKMWELPSGELIRTFSGHTGDVWRLAISPDEKTLASASVDHTVRLWEMNSGSEIDKIKGHGEEVSFLAFTSDGRRLLTGDSRQLKFWELNDLPHPRVLHVPSRCKIEAMSLSPNGKLLAVGEGLSGGYCKPPVSVGIWDIDLAKLKLTIPHKRNVSGLGFLPFRNQLAHSGLLGQVGVFDFETRQEIVLFNGFQITESLPNGSGSNDGVWSFDVSPDGRLIATGSQKNIVKLWTPEGCEVRILRGPGPATGAGGHTVHTLAFSHDGRKLAIGGSDSSVPIFDPESGQMLLRLTGHEKAIRAVKFSSDDRLIATAGEDALIKVWDATDGRLLQTLKGHADQVRCLAWTPDGARLVSGSLDRTIRFWNVALGMEVLALKEHSDAVSALDFSSDGSLLFSASWDGTVRLWKAATEKEIKVRLH